MSYKKPEEEEFQYSYKWDYETILEDLPELQDYLIKGADLKKISEKIGKGLVHLLKRM